MNLNAKMGFAGERERTNRRRFSTKNLHQESNDPGYGQEHHGDWKRDGFSKIYMRVS